MALVPYRVLIVDDDPDTRWMLQTRFALEPDIELVPFAANGEEALERVREHRPAAVVLDIEMPRMDGARAIPELRAIAPGLGIVLHSASDRAESLSGAARPDAVVPKGTPLSHLVAAVRSVARRAAEATDAALHGLPTGDPDQDPQPAV